MNKIFIFLFTFSIIKIFGQSYEREIEPFAFIIEQNQTRNTFSGGVNNPEFQFIDLDGDSDAELIYLCSDGSFEVLENEGSNTFPDFKLKIDKYPGLQLRNWFFFADIDADGDQDYFTSGESNTISLFENIGLSASPNFRLLIDTLRDVNGNIVFSESVSNPSFTDIDGDGDFDLISGNQAGTVNFFENIGTPQNFIFDVLEPGWQNIVIIGGKASARHGASSIEFGDIDGDNDLDLLWGDFFSRSLYYIQNNGDAQNPNMQLVSEVFPQNSDSLFTRGFNMPRLFDIDADGDPDLFASVLYDPTVPQSIIFYENRGNPQSPNYSKVTTDFLFTLDVGTKSTPVFADIDADGDDDLFIGSENNPFGTIFFFENNGSNEFTLVDSSFADIQFDLSVSPAFGDIDGDGDLDLLVGKFLGEISFFENTGTSTNPVFQFQFDLQDNTGSQIKFSNFSRPNLTDTDFDGDLDLTIGAFNGEVVYYRNIGTQNNFNFERDDNFFGSIDAGDQSYPYLIDEDNDGDLDLFIGNREGLIQFYRNAGSIHNPNFQFVTANYFNFDFGGEAAPLFNDIDGDGDADLFAGNIKGGLYFLRNKLISSVENNNEVLPQRFLLLQNYPNPFNPVTKIKYTIPTSPQTPLLTKKRGRGEVVLLNVYDILGNEITTLVNRYQPPGIYEVEFDASNLPSGIYFYRLTAGTFTESKKMMLLK